MSEKRMTVSEKIPVIKKVDVVVCGGGPAGIGAALSSARLGAKTILIEFMGCLGGVAVSGLHMLMWTFNAAEGGNERIVGGIPLEFAEGMVKQGTGSMHQGNFVCEPESMKVTLAQNERLFVK
jgi:flavin-dependent dehydrogenase